MRALAQPHRPRGRPAVRAFLRPSRPFAFAAPQGLRSPKTRIHVRLLGPCFKTGRTNPFHQRHDGARTEAADLDPAKPLADFSDERPSRARAIPDSPAAPPGPLRCLPGRNLRNRPKLRTLPSSPRTTTTENLNSGPLRRSHPALARDRSRRLSRRLAASRPRPLRLGPRRRLEADVRGELPTPVNRFVRFSQ